jgi:choline dehydrogenase-like flavoprotein
MVEGARSVGIENLRIADGSLMPRVTTSNTMAPCVIIGERAAEVLRAKHKLQLLVESVRVSPPQKAQSMSCHASPN